MALIAVAPNWVAEDERRVGAASAAVEVADCAPGDTWLAGGEGRGRGGGGEGCGHEGNEGGGEVHCDGVEGEFVVVVGG